MELTKVYALKAEQIKALKEGLVIEINGSKLMLEGKEVYRVTSATNAKPRFTIFYAPNRSTTSVCVFSEANFEEAIKEYVRLYDSVINLKEDEYYKLLNEIKVDKSLMQYSEVNLKKLAVLIAEQMKPIKAYKRNGEKDDKGENVPLAKQIENGTARVVEFAVTKSIENAFKVGSIASCYVDVNGEPWYIRKDVIETTANLSSSAWEKKEVVKVVRYVEEDIF